MCQMVERLVLSVRLPWITETLKQSCRIAHIINTHPKLIYLLANYAKEHNLIYNTFQPIIKTRYINLVMLLKQVLKTSKI